MDDLPLERCRGLQRAGRIDEQRFERRALAFADLTTGEQRLDTDARFTRIHRQLDAALDRSSARLAQAHKHLRFERPRRFRDLRQTYADRGSSVIPRCRQVFERLAHRRDALVRKTEAITRETRQIAGRLAHLHLAFNCETDCRRPIEVAADDTDGRRLFNRDRLRLRLERQRQALRHEILDEECDLRERLAFDVRVETRAPRPGHRRRGQCERCGAATELRLVENDAAILDAIRTRHDHRCGCFGRCTIAIAQQRRQIHRLTRTIDTAIGVGIGVERTRLLATFDAAIREIERRGCEIEERVVLVAFRDQDRGREAAGAAHQAGIEADVALRVGLAGRQHLVVARDETHRDLADRIGGTERAHECVQAIVAGQRCEAEIGYDEPLRRGRRVVIDFLFRRRRNHQINAGLQIGNCITHRDRGRHFLVQTARKFELALPDALAVALADRLQLVALHLLEEAIERCGARERAITDAQDFYRRLAGIDRNDRNALLAAVRQHIGAARKAHARRAIAHIDRDLRHLRERLADRGRQASAELDLVALAVFETVDAELLVLDCDVLRLATVERDELLQITGGGRQPLGEVDAHARLGRIRLGFVVDDTETVLGAELIERVLRLVVRDELDARRQCLDRGAPH